MSLEPTLFSFGRVIYMFGSAACQPFEHCSWFSVHTKFCYLIGDGILIKFSTTPDYGQSHRVCIAQLSVKEITSLLVGHRWRERMAIHVILTSNSAGYTSLASVPSQPKGLPDPLDPRPIPNVVVHLELFEKHSHPLYCHGQLLGKTVRYIFR